jgi:hypothetical protein
MISIVFIFLAAICNSIMDLVENEPNYNKSIFRKLNKRVWLKTVSWENKYRKIKIPIWVRFGKK